MEIEGQKSCWFATPPFQSVSLQSTVSTSLSVQIDEIDRLKGFTLRYAFPRFIYLFTIFASVTVKLQTEGGGTTGQTRFSGAPRGRRHGRALRLGEGADLAVRR